MINFFIEYFNLSFKYYFWKKICIFFIFTIFIPLAIIWIVYYYIDIKLVLKIIKTSSQELINSFTIISWFLLTWLTIMLSNVSIDNKKIKQIENRLPYWSNVEDIIENMQKLLFFEIIMQFILIIFINVFISIIKVIEDIENCLNMTIIHIFIATTIYFSYFTFFLIRNFIYFKQITFFKFK